MNKLAVKLNRPDPQIDETVMAKLISYSWPGNVRELENIVERMLVLSKDGHIGMDLLPAEFFDSDTSAVIVRTEYLDRIDLHRTVADIEGQLVRWAFAKAGGNLAKAAWLLNIPRSSLQYKISKLDSPVSDGNSS
jgi:arginine utilization regulatory protein